MKKGLIVVLTIALTAVTVAAQSKTRKTPARRQGGAAQPVGVPAASGTSNKAAKPNEDCGCEAEPPPEVVAIVNGVKIRTEEVDAPLKDEIASLRNQVVEARKNELGLQVNSRLLESEARKLGITTERLLEQEVVSKVKEPSETEIRIFYDDNKERIQAEFDAAKPHIARYLLAQRQQGQAKKLADRLRAAGDLNILVTEATPPEKEGDRDRLFATVNGQPVNSGHVEDAMAPLIYSFQQRVYDMRQSRLESMINSMLLKQEAEKRKLTPQALLDIETAKRANAITQEDAKRFYDENKSRITGEYAVLKDQVLNFVREQERRKAEAELADRLRKAASVEVFIKAPESPAFVITNVDQPQRGNENAPVTIVEFTDFECPTCGKTQPVLDELLAEYDGKVKLVVRDFPLDNHKSAMKAAEAAEAARAQGKYWEYMAMLFKNQTALDPVNLKLYAGRLGLDQKKFDSELDSGKYFDHVNRDRQDGLWLGVDATPAFFVNGRRVQSITKEAVKAAIEAALKATESGKKSAAARASRAG
ncbi:MAG TPA: thioredoxin domain-containing protein [Blastocatellia bacterium]|nr:thioredoxin domain-containing protein [Blastocatellia bacterium]